MKKLLFTILILLMTCPVFSCGQRETPINELPMYGGPPFSAELEQANAKFIDHSIQASGSREAAFKGTIGFAWDRYEKGDLRTAMKRFNQAWLLDPNNSEVFRGFGCILFKKGKITEAVEWDRKAAELGNAKAQNNLASDYFNGHGVKQNFNEAVKWYRKAADQGHPMAQHQLGVIYEEGKGEEQNSNEAVKWYRKAAQQGYLPAQKQLRKQGVDWTSS